MLHDSEMLVRLEAILALEKLNDTRAIEALIEALDTDLYAIKFSASQALQKITQQKIGPDYDEWHTWWAMNKSKYKYKRKSSDDNCL